MKLTEHFTLEEMLRSDIATEFKITEQFQPGNFVLSWLEILCENILEPLRLAIGKPIKVTSGYRCPRLNSHKKIKGSKNSQHLHGQAADIQVEGMTNMEIISVIKKLELPIDQCIEEFGRWVHVSHRANYRNEFLKAEKVNGETKYTPLIF